VNHSIDDLIQRGESQKRVGMAIAASSNVDRVTLGRLSMLAALLRSDTGLATIDDATNNEDLATPFHDGGRWRGTVTKSLVADEFATIEGTTKSRRPSRHRGYISVLRLTDRTAAAAYLQSLIRAVASINDETPPSAIDGASTHPINTKYEQGASE